LSQSKGATDEATRDASSGGLADVGHEAEGLGGWEVRLWSLGQRIAKSSRLEVARVRCLRRYSSRDVSQAV
jgi:hypothetical protein